MGTIILKILMLFVTSNTTKTLIAVGVNKLLNHSKDGVTTELAKTLIDAVAESKLNPTTADMFSDALNALEKKE